MVDEHPTSVILGTEVDRSQQLAVSVSGDTLDKLAAKIALGAYFLERGVPVAWFDLRAETFVMPEGRVVQYGGQHTEWRIGRTATITYATVPNDEAAVAVTLWERLHLLAFIMVADGRSGLAEYAAHLRALRDRAVQNPPRGPAPPRTP